MKIKGDRNQMEALLLLIETGLKEFPPEDNAEKLINFLVDDVAEKIRVKLRKVGKGLTNSAQVTLNEKESLGVWVWYHQIQAALTEGNQWMYEDGLMMSKVVNPIDREYT